MSDDTCKSTIVSRVENLGEAAITSWDEQASIRALRVDNANNFCILDYFKSSVLTTIPRGWYCNRGSHRDVARRRVALAADRAGIDAASRETSAIEKLSET